MTDQPSQQYDETSEDDDDTVSEDLDEESSSDVERVVQRPLRNFYAGYSVAQLRAELGLPNERDAVGGINSGDLTKLVKQGLNAEGPGLDVNICKRIVDGVKKQVDDAVTTAVKAEEKVEIKEEMKSEKEKKATDSKV